MTSTISMEDFDDVPEMPDLEWPVVITATEIASFAGSRREFRDMLSDMYLGTPASPLTFHAFHSNDEFERAVALSSALGGGRPHIDPRSRHLTNVFIQSTSAIETHYATWWFFDFERLRNRSVRALEYGGNRRSRAPLALMAHILHAPRMTFTSTLVMHACHMARARLLSISFLVWLSHVGDRSALAARTLAMHASVSFALDRITSFLNQERPANDTGVVYYMRLHIITLAGCVIDPAFPIMLHCPLSISQQDFSRYGRGRYWIWPDHTPTLIARLVEHDASRPRRP